MRIFAHFASNKSQISGKSAFSEYARKTQLADVSENEKILSRRVSSKLRKIVKRFAGPDFDIFDFSYHGFLKIRI